MSIIVGIYDGLTGESITREATPEEAAEYLKDVEEITARKAEKIKQEAEAETKRQALLEKLGITEEEAKLLLS